MTPEFTDAKRYTTIQRTIEYSLDVRDKLLLSRKDSRIMPNGVDTWIQFADLSYVVVDKNGSVIEEQKLA